MEIQRRLLYSAVWMFRIAVNVVPSDFHMALHEAAHLVVARIRLGDQCRVYWVKVGDAATGGAVSLGPQLFEERLDPLNHSVVMMAGLAANWIGVTRLPDEAPLRYADRDFVPGETVGLSDTRKIQEWAAQHDIRALESLARDMAEDPDRFRAQAYAEAEAVVDANWTAIESVARDLQRQRAYFGGEAEWVALDALAPAPHRKEILTKYRQERVPGDTIPKGWPGGTWLETMESWHSKILAAEDEDE